jgi:hypothetical protein
MNFTTAAMQVELYIYYLPVSHEGSHLRLLTYCIGSAQALALILIVVSFYVQSCRKQILVILIKLHWYHPNYFVPHTDVISSVPYRQKFFHFLLFLAITDRKMFSVFFKHLFF